MKKKSLLIMLTLIISFSNSSFAYAKTTTIAGKKITREQTFMCGSNKKKDFKKYVTLPQTFNKGKDKYKLKEIKYETLDTDYLDNATITKKTKEIPKDTIEENGITYSLVSCVEELDGTSKSQKVSGYTEYPQMVTMKDVPQIKEVNVGGKMVTCQLSNISIAGTKQVNNKINIVYETYNANAYEWNGHTISRNDAYPEVGNYESELLASCGLDPSKCKIVKVYWNGAEYTDNGVIKRNATADIKQEQVAYRANYETYVNSGHNKQYNATYEAKDTNGKAHYTIKATGTYDMVKEQKVKKEKISIKTIIAVGGGIVVIALLVAILLYLLGLKKKQEEEDKESKYESEIHIIESDIRDE